MQPDPHARELNTPRIESIAREPHPTTQPRTRAKYSARVTPTTHTPPLWHWTIHHPHNNATTKQGWTQTQLDAVIASDAILQWLHT
jgi:hypothetical protein